MVRNQRSLSGQETNQHKHFSDGCNEHIRTGNVRHLTWTLVDFMKTSEERLNDAGHKGGVACRCSECQRLKDIEDKWICRLGTFNPPHGLNSRDEIKARSRVNFLKQNNLWKIYNKFTTHLQTRHNSKFPTNLFHQISNTITSTSTTINLTSPVIIFYTYLLHISLQFNSTLSVNSFCPLSTYIIMFSF